MSRELRPECPFCGVPLTINHILWQCKKNKEEMTRLNIIKKVWKEGRPRMERLIESRISLNVKRQVSLPVKRLKRVNKHDDNVIVAE
jgi:hypothetical protein